MNHFSHTIGTRTYGFRDLKDLMAKATPSRSGDYLAGVAAGSSEQRVEAQMTHPAIPLGTFFQEVIIPSDSYEYTRAFIESYDIQAVARGR